MKLSTIAAFSTFFLLLAAVAPAAATTKEEATPRSVRRALKQNRVPICHNTGNGEYKLIEVAEPALGGHLGHGDVEPGTTEEGSDGLSVYFDNECIRCYTGTSAQVQQACEDNDSDCCVGADTGPEGFGFVNGCDPPGPGTPGFNPSYYWPSTATVCEGSCNGFGACFALGGGAVVGPNSCTGATACFFVQGNIGPGSCTDVGACLFVQGNVGSGSCTAETVFGETFGGELTVTFSACAYAQCVPDNTATCGSSTDCCNIP